MPKCQAYSTSNLQVILKQVASSMLKVSGLRLISLAISKLVDYWLDISVNNRTSVLNVLVGYLVITLALGLTRHNRGLDNTCILCYTHNKEEYYNDYR